MPQDSIKWELRYDLQIAALKMPSESVILRKFSRSEWSANLRQDTMIELCRYRLGGGGFGFGVPVVSIGVSAIPKMAYCVPSAHGMRRDNVSS